MDGMRIANPVILLDTGNFCGEKMGNPSDLDYRYFFEGMKRLKYDAAGVAGNEIRFGKNRLRKAANDFDLPLVSTNIIDKRGEGPVGSKWIIKDIGGKRTFFDRKGGVRVGIFGVVLPYFIHSIDPEIQKLYQVIDPKIAALQAVSELRARGCDLIVALSFQGWTNTMNLASSVPGIDIVINGQRTHEGTHDEWAGSTIVVDTGNPKKSFTEIKVAFRNGKNIIRATDMGPVAHDCAERADLVELEKRYQRELAEKKKRR